eukprot:4761544-Prymnesium_polylepis.1
MIEDVWAPSFDFLKEDDIERMHPRPTHPRPNALGRRRVAWLLDAAKMLLAHQLARCLVPADGASFVREVRTIRDRIEEGRALLVHALAVGVDGAVGRVGGWRHRTIVVDQLHLHAVLARATRAKAPLRQACAHVRARTGWTSRCH